MRLIIVILISLYSLPSEGKITGIFELRELYYKATTNRVAANKFYHEMENLKFDSEPLMICYRGISLFMMSSHAINPFKKWSYFTKGKELLELSVKKESANAEIRFLRFCIQTNLPYFLNYRSSEEIDKKMLIKEWHNITDNDLKIRIKNYMLQSVYCNEAEKKCFL